MDIKHSQNRTIVPRRDVDRETNRPSAVITRKMTAEEWAKYGPLSERERRVTTTTYTSEDQRRRSPAGKEDEMAKHHVTKELVVEELKKGKSAAQVAREYGVGTTTLYQKMRQWGVSVADVARIEVEELRSQVAELDVENTMQAARNRRLQEELKQAESQVFRRFWDACVEVVGEDMAHEIVNAMPDDGEGE